MNDVRLAVAMSSELGIKDYDQQFRFKLAKKSIGSVGTVDPLFTLHLYVGNFWLLIHKSRVRIERVIHIFF